MELCVFSGRAEMCMYVLYACRSAGISAVPTWYLASIHLEAQCDACFPGNGTDPDEARQRGFGQHRLGNICWVGVALENLWQRQKKSKLLTEHVELRCRVEISRRPWPHRIKNQRAEAGSDFHSLRLKCCKYCQSWKEKNKTAGADWLVLLCIESRLKG